MLQPDGKIKKNVYFVFPSKSLPLEAPFLEAVTALSLVGSDAKIFAHLN